MVTQLYLVYLHLISGKMMVSRVISKNDYPLSIRISIVTIILKTDLKCEL